MAGHAEALGERLFHCDWDIPMTPQPGDEPWPGECRARTVAWFKSRVSRSNEHDAVQAMLRLVEMLGDVLAAGTLAPRARWRPGRRRRWSTRAAETKPSSTAAW
jgi:hypothetical protein